MMIRSIALCLLALAAPAFAATISYVPQTPTTISPGGSVTVNVYGMSINAIGGYSLYLNSSATGSLIQLTSQALNTSLFSYGGPAPSFPQTISTTANSQDLGAFSNSTLSADTQYLLSTVTITLNLSIPAGTYTIGNTAGTVFTDSLFTSSDFAAISTFNISVIPEPSAWGALMAGCLALAVAGRNIPSRRGRA